MKKHFRNWSAFYKKISLFFNGIVAFSLLPFAWVYLEVEQHPTEPFVEGNMLIAFQVIVTIVIGLIVFFGHKQFQASIENEEIREMALYEKLSYYFGIAVRRYMIYEVAAIVCMIAVYFTQQLVFAVVYLFVLFVFSIARPRYDNVVLHLKLSKEEKQMLTDDIDLFKD